jgi:hypothetical protein
MRWRTQRIEFELNVGSSTSADGKSTRCGTMKSCRLRSADGSGGGGADGGEGGGGIGGGGEEGGGDAGGDDMFERAADDDRAVGCRPRARPCW